MAASDVPWPGQRIRDDRIRQGVSLRALTLDSGVSWELLGELPRRAVDFLLITYPPGASSSGATGLMRHTGAEYGFVVRGELVLTLGFEEIHLRPGDAISFESSTPHS